MNNMIYNEVYVATARSVIELVNILTAQVPMLASVDLAMLEHTSGAEVWYDEGTNTVILK
jgi:hypothetical protein